MSASDDFVYQYIVTALWSSTDDNDAPLDDAHTVEDIAQETVDEMRADCDAFVERAAGLYTPREETDAAHDFWLTRNGHGAGFWDGDWTEPAASKLDAIAKGFGSYDLYIGDDGLIYGARG